MSAISVPSRLAALPREGLLRLALKVDAVVTGANGAAYLLAAGPMSDALGLEAALLRGVGAFLLAFAAAVWVVSTRSTVSRVAVLAVVVANVVWAVDSIAMVAIDAGSPTTAGAVWIVMQAVVVGGFAAAQAVFRR